MSLDPLRPVEHPLVSTAGEANVKSHLVYRVMYRARRDVRRLLPRYNRERHMYVTQELLCQVELPKLTWYPRLIPLSTALV